MKGVVCFYLILINVVILNAQAPVSFNYQAVARDAAGNVITGQLTVRFKLHEDNALGTTRYAETHTTTTNAQGVINVFIGKGNIINGNLSTVDWAHHSYFLETEIKTSDNTDFISMGTTQLLSVPYALYAAESGNALTGGTGIEVQNNVINNTGDLSASNELQTLSLNGNQLSISDGNVVTIPTGTTYIEGPGIDINGNTISANDISSTNEIQTLSLNGSQLSLSNGGGSVQLPAGNTSWTTNGNFTYNNPTTNDVGIGTTNNNNAKLSVSATGNYHGGNFSTPGAGDAVHAYCNGTGAGISGGSLNGKGGVFTSVTGTAGYFYSSGGNGLIVENGNVGIGTTAPEAELQVEDGRMNINGKDQVGYYYPSIASYSHRGCNAYFGKALDHGTVAYFSGDGGLGLHLFDLHNGGIGTGLMYEAYGVSSTWNQYVDAAKDLNFAYNGTLKSYIYDTDGSYHTYSDQRLKKDIQPISHVLPGISRLQAYTYHMKDAPEDSPLSVGFMAQEVEAQFPQLVVEKDGYKSLCYDQFAVLSIQAVKEQQEHIDALEQKVKDLETVVMEMKEMIRTDKKNSD